MINCRETNLKRSPPDDIRQNGVAATPISHWTEVSGWFTTSDAEVYRSLVSRVRHGVVVEVGVWMGRSIATVLDTCRANRNRLYAVDSWRSDQTDPGYAEAAQRDISEVFRANMRNLGHESTVEIIREESVRAASLFGDFTLDLMFLDADHSYQEVLRDLRAWLPKIARRGVICGHDYDTRAGVRSAVDEIFGDRVALPGGSMWVVRMS